MKARWKGALIGGIIGMIFGAGLSLIDSRIAFFNKILGNEIYIALSQGGGVAGFFRFSFYLLILFLLIGLLIGYLITKKNEE